MFNWFRRCLINDQKSFIKVANILIIKLYLNKNRVKIQYTTAYVSQQNDVAERKNQMLIEMAQCMLIKSKMNQF